MDKVLIVNLLENYCNGISCHKNGIDCVDCNVNKEIREAQELLLNLHPVIHAKWVDEEIKSDKENKKWYKCSRCGQYDYLKTNYCCSCGAKMDG